MSHWAVTYFDPDIICEIPGGQIVGIDGVRGFIESISQNLSRSELISAHSGGSHTAVLIYDTDTQNAQNAPTTEHLTIRDGRISRMRMIVDRSPIDTIRSAGDTARAAGRRTSTLQRVHS